MQREIIICFSVIQTFAVVAHKRQGLGVFSVCRALVLTWILSLWIPPSRSLQVCAQLAEAACQGSAGLQETQHQALCVGWNDSCGNQWLQKTTPQAREQEGCPGTMGACYSSLLDTDKRFSWLFKCPLAWAASKPPVRLV